MIETIREAVDPEGFSKIVAENAARLYDFDLEFLASKRIPLAT